MNSDSFTEATDMVDEFFAPDFDIEQIDWDGAFQRATVTTSTTEPQHDAGSFACGELSLLLAALNRSMAMGHIDHGSARPAIGPFVAHRQQEEGHDQVKGGGPHASGDCQPFYLPLVVPDDQQSSVSAHPEAVGGVQSWIVPLRPLSGDAARVAVLWGGWGESVKSMAHNLGLSQRQVEQHIEIACLHIASLPPRETKAIIKGMTLGLSSNPVEASRLAFNVLRGSSQLTVSPRPGISEDVSDSYARLAALIANSLRLA